MHSGIAGIRTHDLSCGKKIIFPEVARWEALYVPIEALKDKVDECWCDPQWGISYSEVVQLQLQKLC
jgi:hypothetical protein